MFILVLFINFMVSTTYKSKAEAGTFANFGTIVDADGITWDIALMDFIPNSIWEHIRNGYLYNTGNKNSDIVLNSRGAILLNLVLPNDTSTSKYNNIMLITANGKWYGYYIDNGNIFSVDENPQFYNIINQNSKRFEQDKEDEKKEAEAAKKREEDIKYIQEHFEDINAQSIYRNAVAAYYSKDSRDYYFFNKLLTYGKGFETYRRNAYVFLALSNFDSGYYDMAQSNYEKYQKLKNYRSSNPYESVDKEIEILENKLKVYHNFGTYINCEVYGINSNDQYFSKVLTNDGYRFGFRDNSEFKQMEAIKINMKYNETNIIQYSIHTPESGWSDWKNSGEFVFGSNINAIKIKLNDFFEEIADIKYGVMVSDGKDSWIYGKNGEPAGIDDQNIKIKKIFIELDDKEKIKKKYKSKLTSLADRVYAVGNEYRLDKKNPNPKKTIALLERAIQLSSEMNYNIPYYKYLLGRAYYDDKQYKKAIDSYSDAKIKFSIKVNPDEMNMARCYYYMGRCYEELYELNINKDNDEVSEESKRNFRSAIYSYEEALSIKYGLERIKEFKDIKKRLYDLTHQWWFVDELFKSGKIESYYQKWKFWLSKS